MRHAVARATIIAAALGAIVGCAPKFDRGAKTSEEFTRDHTTCLEQHTAKTAARYGPSRRTDWDDYARCMTDKFYRAP
jgi:hypothetical protein